MGRPIRDSNPTAYVAYYEAGHASLVFTKTKKGVREMYYGFGYTETIFTTSGGQSGSGFTGVAAGNYDDFSRLVTQIGQGPGCALGNCCGGPTNIGMNRGFDGNILGSIVDIPYDKTAAFVHNTIGGW